MCFSIVSLDFTSVYGQFIFLLIHAISLNLFNMNGFIAVPPILFADLIILIADFAFLIEVLTILFALHNFFLQP
ncbi:hypothetical protein CN946_07210 [Bacillus sp. AFS053548]|nr:hypothetical protein COI44_06680 [Bacillus sp. AFS088145]PGM57624.1 hypothetical protein CN946_07210 [Bacillus sp. AFS053548]